VLRTGLVWLWIGTGGESYEYGNEPLGSIKCWDSIEWLYNLSSAQLHIVRLFVLSLEVMLS
jgi:hypothetical protein